MAKFCKVIVDQGLKDSERLEHILAKLQYEKLLFVPSVEEIFGAFNRPYSERYTKRNIYLGKKRGQLVKEAPATYGPQMERHFYYLHAYNCIYDCDYCYLQGQFNNPDLVFFLNYEEIFAEIERQTKECGAKARFHAGEFSDSLATEGIVSELPFFHDAFKRLPEANWELRTKSVKIDTLCKLGPLANLTVSYSLSTSEQSRDHDLLAPSLELRIMALKKLKERGIKFSLHFDPVIYRKNFLSHWQNLFEQLALAQVLAEAEAISLGVLRFPQNVAKEVRKNFSQSQIFQGPLAGETYPESLRQWMMNSLSGELQKRGAIQEKIYFCHF